MYLNTIVLWTLIGCIIIAEVRSIRFTSPQHLFSDEPDILDGYFHTSQNEHERTERSTHQEEALHSRVRRQSRVRNRVPDPVITKSKPLCDHNRLIIRWTDTNLVSQTGAIIALCREDASSRTTRNNAAVFVSYDYGLNWKNVTDKFTQALGKKPIIDMYYTVPESPNFILFTDKVNKQIFYTNDAAQTINATSIVFAPSDVSINRGNPKIVVASSSTRNRYGKMITRLYLSKDGGQTYTILRSYIDVKAYYWGSTEYGDKATDLFIEAKRSGGSVQGFKLDCSTGVTCGNPRTLTNGAPLNGDITDFLVKGPYMFATQHNKGKTGVNLFVKYKRSGTFKKADIITTSPLKEVFVYDVSGGQVMLVVNHRKNETNLYNSLDITGSNYSLSLPRVLYHNPNTEVSSHWLRNAVKYRFVDVWRVRGLPSVYFATQLTVGPVGGRYLISKMTFDKGGIWKKIKGPEKNKYGRPCHYPVCSLHVNLLYGSIYRYSKTTPLMSRKSAPGLLMATGVLGTNLKITPDTYLSRDGGNTFKMVLRGKRRFSFGDHGGFVLASDFQSSRQIQYSVDFENFNPVTLPNTTRNVDIKTILTEPGEKGVVFIVIGLVNGFYHIFQVNATRSLGVPCTEKDFYKVNVTDIGVGGCAIQQVQLRNSSTQCLTGKNYKRVISITYSGCMCRRRHYQCDLQFVPDKRGSCVQRLRTSLIPSHCPEGTHFMQSRGYSKIPQYISCTEDNETRRTLSAVSTPCPVEMLQLAEVKTLPKMKNNMVRIGHGRSLHFKVALKNGYLPHINFTYEFDDYKVNGIGQNYSSKVLKMNKTGSFVLHIKVSNPKSFIQYSINVNVIRPLNATMMKLMTYPEEPSIKEKTAFVLQMPDGIDPLEYGFPLTYHWKIEAFQPSQKTIVERKTLVPTLFTTFKVAGPKLVSVIVSNGISNITLRLPVMATQDLKPKNLRLSFNDPILTVNWDEVKEPSILRYRVFYRTASEQSFQEAKDCNTKNTKCEIRNVTYYTLYFVKVDTALKDGYGPESDTKSIQIPSGKPGVPQKVKLANEGQVKLEASWMPPLLPNGKLTGYKYKFYKAGQTPLSGTIISDPTITTKVFDKLDADVDYMFEVAAMNKDHVGVYSEARSARTGVGKPTLPPTGIVITKVTTTSAQLTWSAPLIKKGSKIYFSPKSYNIYMKTDGKMTKVGKASENRYTFTGLLSDTKYDVGIAAVANEEGPMANFSFTTSMEAPAVPINLKTTAFTAREATFTWSPAGPDDKITTYTLYQLSPLTIGKPWSFTTTRGQVKNLTPFTKYTFAVTASNTHYESGKSENATFTTKEDKPGKPSAISVSDVWPESSSVKVSWEPPRDPNGVITQYTVTWFIQSKNKQTVVSTGEQRWLQIDHLKEATMYTFQVQAQTKVGIGNPRIVFFKTKYYPYGSQSITIPFEESVSVESLAQKRNFKNIFIDAVAKVADIKNVRIADVRLNKEDNAVMFVLISKEELHRSTSTKIKADMDIVKAKLQPSFKVLGASTKANAVSSGTIQTGEPAASSRGSGGSTNMALIVGLVCAAVIVTLIVVVAMMFFRYRRKGLYNKFDNNFQYNHDDDTVRFDGSPEVEMAQPSQKHRHKDIETVPLADADELT